MKHCIFLILMHQSSKSYLSLRKGHPFPYWSQVIAGSLRPFVSTGVTPLGTRHWKSTLRVYFCYLIIRRLSITCLLEITWKKDLQKKISLPNGGRDRCPSPWFVLLCQNDHQDKMGKDVSSQSSFNPKLLIDIYFRDSAFCWWDLVEDRLVVVMIPIIGTQSV